MFPNILYYHIGMDIGNNLNWCLFRFIPYQVLLKISKGNLIGKFEMTLHGRDLPD